MFSFIKTIFWILIVFIVGAGILYYGYNEYHVDPPITPPAEQCLTQVGAVGPSWQTILVSAMEDTDVRKEFLWKELTDLEKWNSWISPQHSNTRWAGDKEWKKGNKFTESLDLGFPIQTKKITWEIIDFIPGEKIVWKSNINDIYICQAWQLIPLSNGRTRIINTVAFNGESLLYFKPLVADAWQKAFDEDAKALIRAAISNN